MDIKDTSDEERDRKKAEKEARKLRKAQKEAAKREKNLELMKQTEKVEDQLQGDQEDDEDVVYGAPDDVAWTDKSAAMLEAEKMNKSGPDLSVCRFEHLMP